MKSSALILAIAAPCQALLGGLGNLFSGKGGGGKTFDPPVIMGDESIMSKKAHGTSNVPVQKNLRWRCGNSSGKMNTLQSHDFFHSIIN